MSVHVCTHYSNLFESYRRSTAAGDMCPGQTRSSTARMVHAALFISPSSSCETARIFVCNCMCISMSYHYSKYEFLGPESDLERYRFRSASSSSLFYYGYVSTEFSVGAELVRVTGVAPVAISVETYQ
jgi:hypothetical protein